MKILVVDDDPLQRTVAASLLRRCGHEVISCADGQLAWHLIQSEGIRLVVSDWMMPNMSGLDLCRTIRAAALDHYVYVILCTSKDQRADCVEGMDAGADDFIVKPVNLDDLRVRVRAGERVLNLERTLADKNQELVRTYDALQVAYAKIQEDLKTAAWAQQNMLPERSLRALGVTCDWRFRPSSYMSGDIFNFFAIDDRHVAFYLLDVSGHGVPAAMSSVALSLLLMPNGDKSPLRRCNSQLRVPEVVDPEEVIADLNARFQSKDDRYFTLTYGLLNVQTATLRLAQAGNPSPVVIDREGAVRSLSVGGMPIGLWPTMEADSIEVPFNRGDRILLYSDGISECTNTADEQFGDVRLLEHISVTARQPLGAMLDGLERKVESWRGSTEFADDISVLAIELTGDAY